MPATKTHPRSAYTKQLHQAQRRRRDFYPVIEDDPALASAYHSLQLHWIKSVPGWREALKLKLSEAAKLADRRARKIELRQQTLHGGTLAQALRDEQLERLAGY